ncbi:MAG: response regulator [Candidatus Marinimicrobia bacterium]|nr:response regulator [Candidatus Neomarinimicrobiota bacterium]
MSISYDLHNVLFIDDEINILKSLERDLRKESFNCFFANTIDQAFTILKTEDISVLVSDLNMPEINGLDLITKVKKDYPYTVRIILTALTDTETILSAITEGNIYRYIVKPWNTRGELAPSLYQAIDQYIFMKEKELRTQELILQNKALTQLNKKLKNAQQEIVDLERKNTALAMGITANHELNQPLMVLSANVELLQELYGNELISEKEKLIFSGSKNALQQINTILKKYREISDIKFENYLDNDIMLVFDENKDKKQED